MLLRRTASRLGHASVARTRAIHVTARLQSPVTADDATFKSLVLDAKKPVVVDFYADWCGPCRMLAPVLERAVAGSDGAVTMVKVDVDANAKTAAAYEITALPTVVVFRDGREHERFIGMKAEPFIKQFVQRAANK